MFHGKNVGLLTLFSTSAAVVTAAYFFWYRYYKTMMKYEEMTWRKVATVAKLYIYPLKSAQGVPVQTSECTKLGLEEGNLQDRYVGTKSQHLTFVQVKLSLIDPIKPC